MAGITNDSTSGRSPQGRSRPGGASNKADIGTNAVATSLRVATIAEVVRAGAADIPFEANPSYGLEGRAGGHQGFDLGSFWKTANPSRLAVKGSEAVLTAATPTLRCSGNAAVSGLSGDHRSPSGLT
jgi:hypothetical protein